MVDTMTKLAKLYNPVRAREFKNMRQARELMECAVEIAEALRGSPLLAPEYSALFYGFMVPRKGEDAVDFNTDWELIAAAARNALDGMRIVDGKMVQVGKSLRKPSGPDNVPE